MTLVANILDTPDAEVGERTVGRHWIARNFDHTAAAAAARARARGVHVYGNGIDYTARRSLARSNRILDSSHARAESSSSPKEREEQVPDTNCGSLACACMNYAISN